MTSNGAWRNRQGRGIRHRGYGVGNVEGGVSRSSSSMPGAARTTSPAMWTSYCSPVARSLTRYSSTASGPLSVACAVTVHQGPGLVDVRGARTGAVNSDEADARRRGDRGVRRSSRAVATRNAGEAAVKAWARTLPSLACIAGGVRTDPGDAVEGGASYLPAAGMEFEADGTAEFVEGEVDGARVVAGGGGELGDVAPAGWPGGAVEVFCTERGVVVRVVERIAAAGHGIGSLGIGR